MVDRVMDRRGFIRIPFNTDIEIRTEDRAIRSRNSIDISLGGLHLTLDEAAPPEGAPCSVKIVLSASQQQLVIGARGAVVRSEPGSLAVQFTELDLDSYQHLQQLILNNTDEPEKAEQEFRSHWGIRPPRGGSGS